MTRTHPMSVAPPDRLRPRRHMTLAGSRADALEFLPALCSRECLELEAGRISLVGQRARVDVRIVGESGGERDARAALLLLELEFEGRSEQEADAFVQRYRQRAHLATRCH